MGDMPCVWCLCWIQAQPFGISVFAYNPARPDLEPVPVRGWADAEDAVYSSGFVVRDQYGIRCGLNASTLVGGDAMCHGHAMYHMQTRVLAAHATT